MKLKSSDCIAAALYLRKYALAVENHLYMEMKANDAKNEIAAVNSLANSLEELAIADFDCLSDEV